MSYRILFLAFLLYMISCKKEQKNIVLETSQEVEERLFEKVDSKYSQVYFNNVITEDINNFFPVFNYAYNGAGVAVGDINNDGLDDIYFTGNQVQDKLYLNKGNFQFEDITQKAGILPKKAWHNGVVMADVNADGFLDIYICAGGWRESAAKRKNVLYINQGDSTFKEAAESFGIADQGFSLMSTFFDADNDNDLDLFVTNRPQKFFIPESTILKAKKIEEHPYRDSFYINDNGTFRKQDNTKGLKENIGYGLGLVASDLDNDHLTDIYVGNDFFENDYCYKNKGNGVLEEDIRGLTNHVSFYTMGVDIVDLNNDGYEDIFALDMLPNDYERSKTTMAPMDVERYNYQLSKGFYNQYMHNVLNLNRGNGFFSDISKYAGVSNTDWSWACLGADFDNDGDNDILVTNGYKRDVWDNDANIKRIAYEKKPFDHTRDSNEIIKELVELYPSIKLPNVIFENQGNLKFKDQAKNWGIDIPSFSNGAAFSDLDNDGDLDLVINNVDDHAFLYQNNSETINKNKSLSISLLGPKANSKGLGAKVSVFTKGQMQFKEFKTVRGYLSSVTPKMHFGLGEDEKIDSLMVRWPDGKSQLLKDVAVGKLQLDYKEARNKDVDNTIASSALFKDITAKVFRTIPKHQENTFNDYKSQVLLPHKLSTNGPVIAVGDFNGDQLEDFYLGANIGSKGSLYFQNSNGAFRKESKGVFSKDLNLEDTFAEAIDYDLDGDLDLIVGSGGNEYSLGDKNYTDRIYINDGKGNFKRIELPETNFPTAKILFEDYDQDEDLDAIVFGRHVPQQYPSASRVVILNNKSGKYSIEKNPLFDQQMSFGMTTDAAFVNLDDDAKNEIIVVGEWMPIRIYDFDGKQYQEVSDHYGLKNTAGWWNKIAVEDLDNDGKEDIILGNLGLNYKYKASKEKPFYVYASDYDNNGTQDVFLAKPYKDKIVPIRGKECSTQQLPGLQGKITSYEQFAKGDIFDIVGKGEDHKYKATEFASVILWNKGTEFELEALPYLAQFSTNNGFIIDDFNGDQVKDIFYAGNRFEVEIETTRSDAGIGGILIQNKSKTFKSMPLAESGVFLPKNVKGIYPITIKGKSSFIVANNDEELQVFSRN